MSVFTSRLAILAFAAFALCCRDSAGSAPAQSSASKAPTAAEVCDALNEQLTGIAFEANYYSNGRSRDGRSRDGRSRDGRSRDRRFLDESTYEVFCDADYAWAVDTAGLKKLHAKKNKPRTWTKVRTVQALASAPKEGFKMDDVWAKNLRVTAKLARCERSWQVSEFTVRGLEDPLAECDIREFQMDAIRTVLSNP